MKRLSLLALAVLSLTLLAACGGTTGGAASTTVAVGTTAASAGPASQTATTGAAATTSPAGMETATSASAQTTPAAMETTTSAAVAGTAATGGTAAAGPMPDLKGRTVLIGSDSTYPPMESVDPKTNQIVGFDPDLMNDIAKLINIKPQFKTANFDTIFAALKNKEFDAVMSSVTITDERKKIVAFSDPYLTIGQIVVVNAKNSKVTSYQDLANGLTVGAQTGTTGETAALEKAKVPDNKLKRYQTIDLAFADLANNSIDAVVADSPTVANYTVQPQYAGKLKVVGEPFTTEDYGIAVNQNDTELLNGFNAALRQLKSGNTIQQLKDKYKIK
ncbi:MAG TPA: basic amino acid ABC transporter substrate-binding protein [Herpetosiphonaceae bacterium]|nr:basic amino acid ABC transporter substrate-binding protein [Herpetosiphonaceae bacterium]